MPVTVVASEPVVPPTPPRPRRFGIELEFVGITQGAARAAIEPVNAGRPRGERWIVKSDGSLQPLRGQGYETTGELVSPPLHSDDRGFEEVKTICRAMTTAGAKVNKTCGFHVHVDAAGLSGAEIAMVISRYAANEALINRFMAPSRQTGNTYCRPATQIYGLRDEIISNPGSRLPLRDLWTGTRSIRTIAGAMDRYCAVNLAAYVRHGTVEFRQHAGTMNWRKVTSWVRFLTEFVEQGRVMVRSRVEQHLLLTAAPLPPIAVEVSSGPTLPLWIRSSMSFRASTQEPADPTVIPSNLLNLRYGARWFRTPAGRAVSARAMSRWSARHAFDEIYKHFIRRAVWTFLTNPDVSNSDCSFAPGGQDGGDGELLLHNTARERSDPRNTRGRRFYQFLNAIGAQAYSVISDPEQGRRNINETDVLVLTHQIARDALLDFGFNLCTVSGVVITPETIRGANFVRVDYHGRPLPHTADWNVIERLWSQIASWDGHHRLANHAKYFALPVGIRSDTETLTLPDSVNAPQAFHPNVLRGALAGILVNRSRTASLDRNIPPPPPNGVGLPLLADLRGESNLWLGITTRVARFLQAREQGMEQIRVARELAVSARREERARLREERHVARNSTATSP